MMSCVPPIDLAVYGRNRLLRVPFSSKLKDVLVDRPRPLLPPPTQLNLRDRPTGGTVLAIIWDGADEPTPLLCRFCMLLPVRQNPQNKPPTQAC